MNLSVKFDGKELGEYIDILQGFTPFVGPSWEPNVISRGDVTKGDDFSYTTYKAKTIPMPFTILDNIKEKYDALQKILNVDEPKKLVFGNTPDRYCWAIPTGDLEFEETGCLGEGTINWLIPEGIAWSTTQKEFTAAKNEDGILEMTIINEGSEAVPIDYEITHNHENGYIGIVSQYGAIELGRIDEEDDGEANKSVQLINLTKYADFDQMTTGEGVTSEKTFGKTGTFKSLNYNGRSWITLSSLGSGNYYRGACKTIALPADENGEVGAANFKAQCRVDYETVKRVRQTGILQFVIGDEQGEVLALIYFNKTSKTSNTAHYKCRVGGQDKNKIEFTPNYANLTTKSGNLISITKNAGLFEFNICGKKYQFRNDTLAAKKAKTVTIFMGNMKGATESFFSTEANKGRMLLTELSFRKDKVPYRYDIPNRYQLGCTIRVDGESSKVYVDNVISMDDEVLGSTYFLAPPGETTVQIHCSEFSTPEPTVKAYIREAFI